MLIVYVVYFQMLWYCYWFSDMLGCMLLHVRRHVVVFDGRQDIASVQSKRCAGAIRDISFIEQLFSALVQS